VNFGTGGEEGGEEETAETAGDAGYANCKGLGVGGHCDGVMVKQVSRLREGVIWASYGEGWRW
jgi:hypothetical protein